MATPHKRPPRAVESPDLEARLTAIEDTQLEILEGQRRILAALDRRSTVSVLLRTIFPFADNHTFSVRELLNHAAIPENQPLREAIVEHVGSLNARAMGRLLLRNEGRVFDGLRIERVGDDRDGALWTVRVCEAKPTLPLAPAVGRAES